MSNIQHIFKVKAEQDGSRLDAALAEAYPEYGLRARRRVWEWCEVSVDGLARKPSYKVRTGQEVSVRPFRDDGGVREDAPQSASGADIALASFSPDGFGESTSFEPRTLTAKTPDMLSGIGALLDMPELDLTSAARMTGPKLFPIEPLADFSGFIPEIVAANGDFTAFFKPGGLASAALTGGGEVSMEELISANWPNMWRSFVDCNPQERSGSAGGPGEQDIPSKPILCNRLDAGTSGLLLGAFGREGLALFREYERDGKAKKKYLALVHGIAPQYMLLDKTLDTYRRKTTLVLPHTDLDYTRHTRAVLLKIFENPEDVEADGNAGASDYASCDTAYSCADPVGNEPEREPSEFARNYAEVLAEDDSFMAGLRYLVSLTGPLSLLELTILRGARHQIRAHLADAGFPIVGDAQYGLESTNRAGRMYLHHFSIALPGFRAEAAPGWRIALE